MTEFISGFAVGAILISLGTRQMIQELRHSAQVHHDEVVKVNTLLELHEENEQMQHHYIDVLEDLCKKHGIEINTERPENARMH